MVKVMAVTNGGGVAAAGFVDILPLVNQIDGAGNAIPHGTIFRCPYFRLLGGGNAVILDPQVGDIGLAVFADRDISSVVANQAVANPGSNRKFDMADGIYVGGLLGAAPTQYVQFSAAGIKIHSPASVVLDAPDVQINASTLEIVATTSASITTPTFTVNGNQIITGNSDVGGTLGSTGSITTQGDVNYHGALNHI
jgi:hypothetical protein